MLTTRPLFVEEASCRVHVGRPAAMAGFVSREEGPPGCRGGWWLGTSKKQVTSSSGLDSRPSRSDSNKPRTLLAACCNKIFCVNLYSFLLVAMMNFLRYSCCWTIFFKKMNSLTACLDLQNILKELKSTLSVSNYKIFNFFKYIVLNMYLDIVYI